VQASAPRREGTAAAADEKSARPAPPSPLASCTMPYAVGSAVARQSGAPQGGLREGLRADARRSRATIRCRTGSASRVMLINQLVTVSSRSDVFVHAGRVGSGLRIQRIAWCVFTTCTDFVLEQGDSIYSAETFRREGLSKRSRVRTKATIPVRDEPSIGVQSGTEPWRRLEEHEDGAPGSRSIVSARDDDMDPPLCSRTTRYRVLRTPIRAAICTPLVDPRRHRSLRTDCHPACRTVQPRPPRVVNARSAHRSVLGCKARVLKQLSRHPDRRNREAALQPVVDAHAKDRPIDTELAGLAAQHEELDDARTTSGRTLLAIQTDPNGCSA